MNMMIMLRNPTKGDMCCGVIGDELMPRDGLEVMRLCY
jgi:hypothetical protein